MAINANGSNSHFGLGIHSNADRDVLGFAKRLLYDPSTAANGLTSPTRTGSGSGSGKRPLFTRDHSRTSSSNSVLSLRTSVNDRREDEGVNGGDGNGSAGPSSPSSVAGLYAAGEISPRRRPLFSSTSSRRQVTQSSNSEEKRALARLVGMYEELSQHLTDVLTQQDDLETNLKIARSNLALAENHAEALEDTIKRNSVRYSSGNMSPIIPPPPIPSINGGGGTAGRNSTGSRPNSVASASGLSQRNGVGAANRSPNPNNPSINTSNLLLSTTAEEVAEESSPATTTVPSPRLGGFWRKRPTVNSPNTAAISQQQQNIVGSVNGKEQISEEEASSSSGVIEGDNKNAISSLIRKPSFGMLRSSSAGNSPSTEKERSQAFQILSLQNQLTQLQHSYSLLSNEHTTLRESRSELNKKYLSLQEEIENLSVELFQEANKMVAEEKRVNGFLTQQLEKAKMEVDELQGQLEELRKQRRQGYSSTVTEEDEEEGSLESSRRASDASSSSMAGAVPPTANGRSRTGTMSSAHSRRKSVSSLSLSNGNHKRRRSATIPALDAIDALVASTPRRASRDMAAAAAAVKALAQRERDRESLDMPRLPSSASLVNFGRVPEESRSEIMKEEEQEDENQREKARSAPNTAVTNAVHWPSSSSSNNRATASIQRSPPLLQPADAETNASNGQESTSNRSRWFSFGSLKRKSPAIGSLSPSLPSPNPSIASDTNTISPSSHHQTPQSVITSSFSANAASTSTTLQAPYLPRSPSSRSIAESIIPLPVSPPRSRTTSIRSVHARTASTSSLKASASSYRPASPLSASGSGHSRTRSSASTRDSRPPPMVSPPLEDRQPPLAPRDRFFASSSAAATSTSAPSAQSGIRQRADTVQSELSQFTSMTDLHSMLDEVANDLQQRGPREGDNLLGGEESEVPLPFSRSMAAYRTQNGQRPELGRQRTHSWKGKERDFEYDLDDDAEGDRTIDGIDDSQEGMSNDEENMGTLRLRSPPSQLSSKALQQPSTGAGRDLRSRLPNPNLRIQTSSSLHSQPSSIQSGGGAVSPTSPFPMPTPPPFKRFPSNDPSQRLPPLSAGGLPNGSAVTNLPSSDLLNRNPSQTKSSFSLLRKDFSSGPISASSTSSLSKFWDSQRLNGFGSGSNLGGGGFPMLERQNSGLSGTGSVVDDLDSLMQSIDAMNESLGLEDGPV